MREAREARKFFFRSQRERREKREERKKREKREREKKTMQRIFFLIKIFVHFIPSSWGKLLHKFSSVFVR